MDIAGVVERIGELEALDKVAKPLATRVGELIGADGKHALSGAWLGHPLHPLLTDIPIGAWTSAAFLDLIPGRTSARAARTLTGIGILAAIPTAMAGASDWSDLSGEDRRIGLVHAAANSVGLLMFTRSFAKRVRGHHLKGRLWSMAGIAAMSAGGYLGGHLSYRRGVGVNRHAFDGDVATDWTPLGALTDLPEGKPTVRKLDGVDVMVLRRGTTVSAIANACAHLGGPLDEGTIDGDTVTCPWHGSVFDLTDGSILRGPATAPQPCFEARVEGGQVQIRRRQSPAIIDLTAPVATGVAAAPTLPSQ